MQRRILGIVLGTFFAALIATPVVIKRFSKPQAPGGVQGNNLWVPKAGTAAEHLS